jgi:hypothetical protein
MTHLTHHQFRSILYGFDKNGRLVVAKYFVGFPKQRLLQASGKTVKQQGAAGVFALKPVQCKLAQFEPT